MITTHSIIYSVGTPVEVDDTKTGYIIEIDNTDDNNIHFKISYVVGNEIEERVEEARCRPVSVVFENGVEKDSTGGEVLLPFDYRPGWVGYLGYKMRHLVDKSAEVPSPGAVESQPQRRTMAITPVH